MASVTLKDVRKSYGSNVVVKQLSLEIHDEEFLVLLGPSGCGKSTLLRMIAGLESITDGEIAIGDRVVNKLDPGERDIAMVFQNYALYPHMTVRQNIGFCLQNMKVSRADIAPRVDEVARILKLDELLDRFPAELSGGQRQRVAIGRALVRKPKVFLMDEPLSNLDAKLRGNMRTEIARLHEQLRITTIYVTHDQVEAMTMADRIVILDGGIVQQIGAPMEIYNRPHNRFVAGFIGSPGMNFLRVTIGKHEGERRLRAAGVDIELTAKQSHRLESYAGQELVLGCRPQDLVAANGAAAMFSGPVVVSEPYGAETYVTLQLGDHTLTARLDPSIAPRKQETLGLCAAPEKLYFFDPYSDAVLY